MTPIRRLSWLALGVAFVHSVFGAIVRISGSGMGCGEHWPDCNGSLVPTFTSYTTVVELTHRGLAAALLAVTAALVVVARRSARGDGAAGTRGSVLRAASLALGLEVVAALVGMVVVMLALSSRALIAVHYTIAMAILATLVIAVQRSGGLGAAVIRRGDASPRTYRGAAAAAGIAFVTVVFGALTANLAGAAESCLGFPWCRLGMTDLSGTLPVQITHRALALLLFLHLLGLASGITRRRESRVVVRAAWAAFGVVVLQIVVAASLVELRLPPALQSLHQATGTLVWVAAFALAALARRAAAPAPVAHTADVSQRAGAAGAVA
ncbi:MAG: heme A synthase [Gemmatimonadales bacterium]|jgi:heme A synthase